MKNFVTRYIITTVMLMGMATTSFAAEEYELLESSVVGSKNIALDISSITNVDNTWEITIDFGKENNDYYWQIGLGFYEGHSFFMAGSNPSNKIQHDITTEEAASINNSSNLYLYLNQASATSVRLAKKSQAGQQQGGGQQGGVQAVDVPTWDANNVGKVMKITQSIKNSKKANNYDIQLFAKLSDLPAGGQYSISFYAKATKAYNLGVALSDGTQANTNYSADYSVTTEWQKFTFDVTVSYAPTQFFFQSGLLDGTVYIDHIVIKNNSTNVYYQGFETATFGKGNSYDIYYGEGNVADSWSIVTYPKQITVPVWDANNVGKVVQMEQPANKTNYWDSQVNISLPELTKAHTYTVTFKVKATHAFEMHTEAVDDKQEEHKTNWGGSAVLNTTETIAVGTEWADGTITIKGVKDVHCHSHCTHNDGFDDHKNGDNTHCTETIHSSFQYAPTCVNLQCGLLPAGEKVFIDHVIVKDADNNVVFYQDFEDAEIAEYNKDKDVYYLGYTGVPWEVAAYSGPAEKNTSAISWQTSNDMLKMRTDGERVTRVEDLLDDPYEWYVMGYDDGETVTYLFDNNGKLDLWTDDLPSNDKAGYVWKNLLFTFSSPENANEWKAFACLTSNNHRLHTNGEIGLLPSNDGRKMSLYNGLFLTRSNYSLSGGQYNDNCFYIANKALKMGRFTDPSDRNYGHWFLQKIIFNGAAELSNSDITPSKTTPNSSDPCQVAIPADTPLGSVLQVVCNFEHGGSNITIKHNDIFLLNAGPSSATPYDDTFGVFLTNDLIGNTISIYGTAMTIKAIRILPADPENAGSPEGTVAPNSSNMVNKLWSGSLALTENGDSLNIMAKAIKNGHVYAGSTIEITYDNENQESNLSFEFLQAGQWTAKRLESGVTYNNGVYTLAASENASSKAHFTLSQSLIDLITPLSGNNPGIKITGNHITIKEIKIYSALTIADDNWTGSFPLTWNYLERAFISENIFDEAEANSTLKFTYSTSGENPNPQIALYCNNCDGWTKLTPVSTATLNGESVYESLPTGEVRFVLSSEILSHLRNHNAATGIAVMGNDIILTGMEIIAPAAEELSMNSLHWVGSYDATWGNNHRVAIQSSLLRNLSAGSKIQYTFHNSGDGELQLQFASNKPSYTIHEFNNSDIQFEGTYTGYSDNCYHLTNNSTKVTITLTEAFLDNLCSYEDNALIIKGNNITFTDIEVKPNIHNASGINVWSGTQQLSKNYQALAVNFWGDLNNDVKTHSENYDFYVTYRIDNSNKEAYLTLKGGNNSNKEITNQNVDKTISRNTISLDLSTITQYFNESTTVGFWGENVTITDISIVSKAAVFYEYTTTGTKVHFYRPNTTITAVDVDGKKLAVTNSEILFTNGNDHQGEYTKTVTAFYDGSDNRHTTRPVSVRILGTAQAAIDFIDVQGSPRISPVTSRENVFGEIAFVGSTTDQHVYAEVGKATVNGLAVSTFKNPLSLIYKLADNNFVPQRIEFRIFEDGVSTRASYNGQVSVQIKKNYTVERSSDITPGIGANGWDIITIPVSADDIYEDGGSKCVKVTIYPNRSDVVYGISHATLVGVVKEKPTLECDDIILFNGIDDIKKCITSNSNGAISVISNNTGIATVSIVNDSLKVDRVAAGSTTITITQAATEFYHRTSKTVKVIVRDGSSSPWWSYDFTTAGLNLEYSSNSIDGYYQLMDGEHVAIEDFAVCAKENDGVNKFFVHEGGLKAHYGGARTFRVLNAPKGAYIHIEQVNYDQKNVIDNATNASVYAIKGNHFIYKVNSSGTVTFTVPRYTIIHKIEVVTDVNYATITSANEATWTFDNSTVDNGNYTNGGQNIYWSTKGNAVKTAGGLTGLKVNEETDIFFFMPSTNLGGRLNVTFGSNDGNATTIKVNGIEATTTSTEGTTENFTIAAGTKLVSIQQTNGEGVISHISWIPWSDTKLDPTFNIPNINNNSISVHKFEPVSITIVGDGTPSCSSSNSNVAQISFADGKFSLIGIGNGSTTVTIRTDVSETYKSKEQTFTVNVLKETEVNKEITWNLKTLATSANINAGLKTSENLHWTNLTNAGLYSGSLSGISLSANTTLYFDLPEGNKGGIVSVTFGPKVSTQTTAIEVNNYGNVSFTGSTKSQTLQHSFQVAANEKSVVIRAYTAGEHFDEGVITSVSWMPTPEVRDEHSESITITSNGGIETSVLKEADYVLDTSTANKVTSSVSEIYVTIPSSLVSDHTFLRITGCSAKNSSEKISIVGKDALGTISLASYDKNPTIVEVITNECGETIGEQRRYTININHSSVGENPAFAYLKFEVVEHDYVRTGLSMSKIGTICLPFDVDGGEFAGARFFLVNAIQVDENKWLQRIWFEEVDHLEAGLPYLYIADNNFLTADFARNNENAFKNRVTEPIAHMGMIGTFDRFNFKDHGWYSKRYYGISKNSLVSFAETSGAGANKAIFDMELVDPRLVPSSPSGAKAYMDMNGFNLEEETDITSIEEISSDWQSDENIYDLQGRVIAGQNKGMMIQNRRIIIAK